MNTSRREKRHIGEALVAAVFLASASCAFAETESVGGYTWTYQVNGGAAEIYNDGSCAVSPLPSGKVVIPDTLGGLPVAGIGASAFISCRDMTGVAIPDSVSYIGEHAFSGCYNLTDVALGNGVTNIGKYAFYFCFYYFRQPVRLVIPDSVTSIGPWAFASCHGIAELVVGNGVEDIGEWAFCNNDELIAVTVGRSLVNLGSQAFFDCHKIASVVLPDSVVSIGEQTFAGCYKMKDFKMPAGLTNVGFEAFHSCKALEGVTMPSGLATIGIQTFGRCENLKAVAYTGDRPEVVDYDGETVTGGDCLYRESPNDLISVAPADNGTWSDAFVSGEWMGRAMCAGIAEVLTIGGGKTSMSRAYDTSAYDDCFFSVACGQAPWTAVSSASWVTLQPGSEAGTDSGKIYYDVTANTYAKSRTATVKVTCCGLVRTCTIAQKAAPALLTIGGGKTSMSRWYSCEAKLGESFSVACNGPWSAKASADWITIIAGHPGNGNGTLKYYLAENTGASKREGAINVKSGGITRTCTITQDKPLLIGGKTSMLRTYDAATHADCYFTVTCSQASWTAVSSASWVTLHSDSKSGTGTAKLRYDVAANTSASQRTATIKVTSRGLTRMCTIKQKGRCGVLPMAI